MVSLLCFFNYICIFGWKAKPPETPLCKITPDVLVSVVFTKIAHSTNRIFSKSGRDSTALLACTKIITRNAYLSRYTRDDKPCHVGVSNETFRLGIVRPACQLTNLMPFFCFLPVRPKTIPTFTPWFIGIYHWRDISFFYVARVTEIASACHRFTTPFVLCPYLHGIHVYICAMCLHGLLFSTVAERQHFFMPSFREETKF